MDKWKWMVAGTVGLLLGVEALLFAQAGFFEPRFLAGFEQGHIAWAYGAAQDPGSPDPPVPPAGPAAPPSGGASAPPSDPAPPTAVSPDDHRAALERGLLLLVNKQNPLEADYKPDDLAPVLYYAEDRTVAGRFLREEAADQFHRMVEAARDEGLTLVMTTAYRSYGFQQVLWDNYVAKEGEAAAARYSARPGQSEHQTGLAVDVTSPSVDYELTEAFGSTPEGSWLAANASRFGFILRYPAGKEDVTGYQYEPWHLRYVGQPVAAAIAAAGSTLEEYLERN